MREIDIEKIETWPWHEIDREYRTAITKIIESKKDQMRAAAPNQDYDLMTRYVNDMGLKFFFLGMEYQRDLDLQNHDPW